MGAAARQRGDAVIRRQCEELVADPSRGVWPILDRLDGIPAGPVRPLAPSGVVRPDEHGRLWMMNRQEGGWASFGVPYPRLDAIRRRFAIRFTGFGRDEHGHIWTWEAL